MAFAERGASRPRGTPRPALRLTSGNTAPSRALQVAGARVVAAEWTQPGPGAGRTRGRLPSPRSGEQASRSLCGLEARAPRGPRSPRPSSLRSIHRKPWPGSRPGPHCLCGMRMCLLFQNNRPVLSSHRGNLFPHTEGGALPAATVPKDTNKVPPEKESPGPSVNNASEKTPAGGVPRSAPGSPPPPHPPASKHKAKQGQRWGGEGGRRKQTLERGGIGHWRPGTAGQSLPVRVFTCRACSSPSH